MENSSLNKAHQLLRHAELQLRNGNFDKTLSLYDQALDLFQESLKLTQNAHAIESIKLQHEHLLRQKRIVKSRLGQDPFQKLNQTHADGFALYSPGMTRYVQRSINDKLEKFDQLLSLLGQSDTVDGGEVKTVVSADESCEKAVDRLSSSLTASTKSNNNVVDDLKALNDEVRSLFVRLNTQIDGQNHEIDLLKAKIKQMEAGGFKETSTGGLKVCDLSGDASPYLISPYELCPDVLED